MSVFRSGMILGSILGAFAVAACDGNNGGGDVTDADATSDIGRDTPADISDVSDVSVDTVPVDVTDVVPADVTDVVVTDSADDGADAVTDSGPACPSTPVPSSVYASVSSFGSRVALTHVDATAPGGMRFVGGRAEIRNVSGIPAFTEGDCVQYQGHNPARTDPQDIGPITISQGSSTVTFTYDTAMSAYVSPGFGSFALMGDTDVNFAFAASDAGPAETVTLRFPPLPAVGPVFSSAGLDPAGTMTIPRTADMVVTWTPEANDGLITQAVIIDPANATQNAIICGVHACSGRMAIPTSMLARYAAGTVLQLQFGHFRMTPLPPTGRDPSVAVGVGALTIYLAAAE